MAAIDVVSGHGDANFGAVYENVIAQELAAAGFPLYYYFNSRKGELDFLLETGEGKILPIQVKSRKGLQAAYGAEQSACDQGVWR